MHLLCDAFVDILLVMLYRSVVSIFSCPSISLASCRGIPLDKTSVAKVLRNRCGCAFFTPARLPNFWQIAHTPFSDNLLFGLLSHTNSAGLLSVLDSKYSRKCMLALGL